jgi:hypothetical protein
MPDQIAEYDLTVEYCQPHGASMKLWCVLKGGRLVLAHENMQGAVSLARDLAIRAGCVAWLLADGCEPQRIPTG